jgi:hypothetical protein
MLDRRPTLHLSAAVVAVVLSLSLSHSSSLRAAAPVAIRVSSSATLQAANPLEGQLLRGSVYFFVPAMERTRRVTFRLDGSTRPIGIGTLRPDGAGGSVRSLPRPIDLRRIRSGRHTLTATLHLAGGRVRTVAASFLVRHLAIAPGGSDEAPCTPSRPCRSFHRAYAVARPGDVVEAGTGSYGEQWIRGSIDSPGVLFRPAVGASPSVAKLRVAADNVEVQSMRVQYWEGRAESNGLTMRNVDSNVFGIYGASNLKVLGGDVGPSYNPGGTSTVAYITWGASGTVLSRNIVFDGVYFHDFRRGTPEDHMECVFVTGVDGLVIRNSRFQRCDIFSIYFGTPWWGAPEILKNVTIENNFFDKSTADGRYDVCCTHYSIRVADDWDLVENLRVAYNSFLQPASLDGVSKVNVSAIGNVSAYGGCARSVSYAYNVWQHDSVQRCSSTDKGVVGEAWGYDKLGFVNPGTLDLRLRPGSRAIDSGDRSDFPRRDIEGKRRPTGRAPDAGAIEAR